MENNRTQLSPEELETVNGGWDLKSLWKKIRGWITDDNESSDVSCPKLPPARMQ